MKEETCSILVAFAHAEGIGRKAILEIRTRNRLGVEQNGKLLTSTEFEASVRQAYNYALRILGDPVIEHGFSWSLQPTPGDFVPVGNPDGGSLYGGFAMTFLQLIARTAPLNCENVRSQIWTQIPAIREACISKVAISAEGEKHTGDFCRTGGITQKIVRLRELKSTELTAFIVCRAQDDLPPDVSFPILNASDPVDAFGKLFEYQTRLILRRIL